MATNKAKAPAEKTGFERDSFSFPKFVKDDPKFEENLQGGFPFVKDHPELGTRGRIKLSTYLTFPEGTMATDPKTGKEYDISGKQHVTTWHDARAPKWAKDENGKTIMDENGKAQMAVDDKGVVQTKDLLHDSKKNNFQVYVSEKPGTKLTFTVDNIKDGEAYAAPQIQMDAKTFNTYSAAYAKEYRAEKKAQREGIAVEGAEAEQQAEGPDVG